MYARAKLPKNCNELVFFESVFVTATFVKKWIYLRLSKYSGTKFAGTATIFSNNCSEIYYVLICIIGPVLGLTVSLFKNVPKLLIFYRIIDSFIVGET